MRRVRTPSGTYLAPGAAPNDGIARAFKDGEWVVIGVADVVDAATRDLFTDVADGLTPASGGGITNFLRADGTWAAPPGGGGGGTWDFDGGDSDEVYPALAADFDGGDSTP